MRFDGPVHMKQTAFSLLLVAAFAGNVFAGRPTSSVSTSAPGALSVLRNVTAAEIPSVASRWVSQAAADQRESRALEAVKAVVALSKPGLLPYVVTAVSQAAPSAAPRVAAEAAALAPDFALAATKAAIAAAPAEVERIVAAVCRQAPELAAGVGVVAHAQTPERASDILKGIASGVPALEPLIAKAVQTVAPSQVPQVMEQVREMAATVTRNQQRQAQSQTIADRVSASGLAASDLTSGLVDPAEQVRQADRAARVQIARAEQGVRAPVSGVSGLPHLLPPPAVGPPYMPLPTLYGEIKTGDTTVVVPGSPRDYSAP
jgi:hypothetical protein